MKSNLDLGPYEYDLADFVVRSAVHRHQEACSPSLQGAAGSLHCPGVAYRQVCYNPSDPLVCIAVDPGDHCLGARPGVPQGVRSEVHQGVRSEVLLGVWTGMQLAVQVRDPVNNNQLLIL